MDDTQLQWLMEGVATSHGIEPESFHIPEELREVVSRYERALEVALAEALDGDEDLVDTLMGEGEAPINVLLTLEGSGIGIWDGRWSPYLSEEDIARVQHHLKERLSRYADVTGGGELELALMDAVVPDVDTSFVSGDEPEIVVTPKLEALARAYEEDLHHVIASMVHGGGPEAGVFASSVMVRASAPRTALAFLRGEGELEGPWRDFFTDDELEDLAERMRTALARYGAGTDEGEALEAYYLSPRGTRAPPRVSANRRRRRRNSDGDEYRALERELAMAETWQEREELREMLAELDRQEADARYYLSQEDIPPPPRRAPRRTRRNRGRRGRIVRQTEFLPGGLGAGLEGYDDIDPEQLEMGIQVELEHIDPSNPHAEEIAAEIASDHLRGEDPYYYDKLIAAGL